MCRDRGGACSDITDHAFHWLIVLAIVAAHTMLIFLVVRCLVVCWLCCVSTQSFCFVVDTTQTTTTTASAWMSERVLGSWWCGRLRFVLLLVLCLFWCLFVVFVCLLVCFVTTTHQTGKYWNCTGGVTNYLDQKMFTKKRVYMFPYVQVCSLCLSLLVCLVCCVICVVFHGCSGRIWLVHLIMKALSVCSFVRLFAVFMLFVCLCC